MEQAADAAGGRQLQPDRGGADDISGDRYRNPGMAVGARRTAAERHSAAAPYFWLPLERADVVHRVAAFSIVARKKQFSSRHSLGARSRGRGDRRADRASWR